jgi:sugar lactone lactonase YvrE
MEDHREEPDRVMAFALADGSVRRTITFAAGEPHGANDLAIASDGTVYVTDMIGGAIYRIPPDRDAFAVVVPPGTFAYPNGLALLDDSHLYVADAIGIAVIALAAAPTVTPLTAPAGIALGGIDGMVVTADHIYAVQNGIGEPRIIAVAFAGTRALSLEVLENDPAALAIPTTACLRDGALYTIANTNLGAFTPKGLAPGRTLSPPRILRTPLK